MYTKNDSFSRRKTDLRARAAGGSGETGVLHDGVLINVILIVSVWLRCVMVFTRVEINAAANKQEHSTIIPLHMMRRDTDRQPTRCGAKQPPALATILLSNFGHQFVILHLPPPFSHFMLKFYKK